MADAGYAVGLGVGTALTISGGPTGTVIENLTAEASAGQTTDVYNNDAGQTLAQSIASQIKGTFSCEAEFKGWADPYALVGKTGTAIAKSDNATQVSGSTMNITINHAKMSSQRGNWMFTIDGTYTVAAG